MMLLKRLMMQLKKRERANLKLNMKILINGIKKNVKEFLAKELIIVYNHLVTYQDLHYVLEG